jgi:hypothetical protein
MMLHCRILCHFHFMMTEIGFVNMLRQCAQPGGGLRVAGIFAIIVDEEFPFVMAALNVYDY